MLSAVVLTHNDESNITRCLESLSWCNDVIVIDDESTDDTVAIAKKLVARVFTRPLEDNFASQRNFALEKAKGPASTRGGSSTRGGEWVLFVDSDEVVTPQLASEIQSILSSRGRRRRPWRSLEIASSKTPRNDDVRGYFIKRKDLWGGRWLTHGETGNVRLVRLARKDAGKWEQPVHEQWKVCGPVGELVHPLLHYPHQNVAQFLNEINRYSTVYASFLHSQGVKEPVWHIVAKPLAKFFINYFWRLGFLDGTPGITVALMMSFHSFLVRGKLWHLWQRSS